MYSSVTGVTHPSYTTSVSKSSNVAHTEHISQRGGVVRERGDKGIRANLTKLDLSCLSIARTKTHTKVR